MTTFFDFFVAPVGVTEYDRSDIHEFAKLLDTTLFPFNFDDDEALRLKNLSISKKRSIPYKIKRESIIDNLANEFDKHLNITSLLN